MLIPDKKKIKGYEEGVIEKVKDLNNQNGVGDIIETEALDTIGNAYYTRRIVDTISSVERIYVVSSC